MRLDWQTVNNIMKAAVERGWLRREDVVIARAGIDEKSFRRGHVYASILHDLDNSRVRDLVEGRKTDNAMAMLDTLTGGPRLGVKAVAMNRWAAFDHQRRFQRDKFTGCPDHRKCEGAPDVRRPPHPGLVLPWQTRPLHRLKEKPPDSTDSLPADPRKSTAGAGDQNRTDVSSLGSSCSTIELHPQTPRRRGMVSSSTRAERKGISMRFAKGAHGSCEPGATIVQLPFLARAKRARRLASSEAASGGGPEGSGSGGGAPSP